VEYVERIDSTLAPYAGRFIVHGGPADVRRKPTGDVIITTGDVIIIDFPARVPAAQWHESPAYQAILPPRANNSVATAC
jgi:uncharacterized protein (DUF1330 family)